MRKLLLIATLLFTVILASSSSLAKSRRAPNETGHTTQEEAEGKEIWEKLQAKQLECKNLTDENYQALGEYFMGQAIGNTQRHELMNRMMTGMMGEEGEKQMHVVIGKRLSSCDTSAQVPSSGAGFMPMMWMIGGGGNSMMGSGWGNTMGWGFGIGWIFMIVFWILIILGIVALVRYLARSGENKENATPLDILKKRYARGEVDKKELKK